VTAVCAYLAHRAPGRLRLRIPERRGDADYFRRVAEALAGHAGVSAVEVSAVTAGVLVRHAGSLSVAEVSRCGRVAGLFDLDPGLAAGVPAVRQVAAQLRAIDVALRGASRNEADVRSLVFVGMLGLAAVQLLRGHVLGPATTLLWQAFQLAGGHHLGENGEAARQDDS
jgi:hypothetical protein